MNICDIAGHYQPFGESVDVYRTFIEPREIQELAKDREHRDEILLPVRAHSETSGSRVMPFITRRKRVHYDEEERDFRA